ncbi:MAG: hypothetical protein Q8P18_02620 [Pseudomonadota bacterium]|nr:hypothetical protein [Pseudomonadota bacterium]
MRVSAPLCVVPAWALLVAFTLPGCNGCRKEPPADDDTDPIGVDAEPDPHDIGSWLSMRVMPDGRPAISFYDRTSDALGFAIGTLNDGVVSWSIEQVDSYPDATGLNPGDAGKYSSMAVASDGTVWVVYQDTSNGVLKYAKREKTGAWTIGNADTGGGPSYDSGYWASVAIDPAGNPVAAHYDAAKGSLRVARWTGTAFTAAVVYEGTDYASTDTAVESVSGNAGEYARIAIASDGTEYIAFYDRAWGALRLASGNVGGYSIEVVDDTSDVGQWPDVMVDGASVAIAYHDVSNQDLKLAKGRAGGPWNVETVDSGDHVGADSAIYGTGSEPGIVYFDGANNDMKLARMSGASWALETVGTAGAAVGYHNETVEIDGTRYVASYDYTNRTVWFSALP